MNVEFLNFQNMATKQNENNGVFARFYDKAIRTGNMQKNGLPEFINQLYIEIKVRDERDVFDQPATADHIKRFAIEYNRYLNRKEKTKEGTPIELFAFLSKDQIESCLFRGIESVEDLSALSDEAAKDLGLTEQRDLSLLFLQISKNNRFLDQMRKKQKEQEEEIKALKEEIKRLKENGDQ